MLLIFDTHHEIAGEPQDVRVDDLDRESVLVHVLEPRRDMDRAGVDFGEGVEGDRGL
jgi:hypothetical protein